MPLSRLSLHWLMTLTLLALIGSHADLVGLDASKNPGADLTDDEVEDKYITTVLEEAAKYRLARSVFVSTPAYENEAAEYLREAQAVQVTGDLQPLERYSHHLRLRWWFFTPPFYWRGLWLAEDGFNAFPFSRVAGELLEIQINAYARRGDVEELHDALFKLWFWLPNYPNFPRVMKTALDTAYRLQDFSTSVHLESEDPNKVIRINGPSSEKGINKLFSFLVEHGDRESIAPSAAIGLARAQLRSGSRDDLFLARRAYERFCETYPTSDLIFTALCEQALSYLIAYKGSNYDVGVLIRAEEIIDQAAIESQGKDINNKTIELYRKRISSWRQDRDLEVARWYRERVTTGFSWLMCPGVADGSWLVGAKYFYQEVINRNNSTPQARSAQLELSSLLAEMQQNAPSDLGIDLLKPAKP